MSLPPQKRRSPKVLAFLIALTTGTMAYAASRITRTEGAPLNPEVALADQKTVDIADMRIRAHLKKLER